MLAGNLRRTLFPRTNQSLDQDRSRENAYTKDWNPRNRDSHSYRSDRFDNSVDRRTSEYQYYYDNLYYEPQSPVRETNTVNYRGPPSPARETNTANYRGPLSPTRETNNVNYRGRSELDQHQISAMASSIASAIASVFH